MNNDVDFGFVIISNDGDVVKLNTTLESITHTYNKYKATPIPIICSSSCDLTPKIKVPTFKTEPLLTELLNTGISNNKHEWSIVLQAGTRVQFPIHKKLFNFVKSNEDILYVVTTRRRHFNFINSDISGFTIHSSVFNKIGMFSKNPIEISKTFWAMDAVENGFKFKGIAGFHLF